MKLLKNKKAISLLNIILLVTLLIIIGWGFFGKYFSNINLGIFSNNKCEQAGKTADYYQSEINKTLIDAVLLSAKTDIDSQKLLAEKNQTILLLFKEYTGCYLAAYEDNNFKAFTKNPLDTLSFNKNTLVYFANLLYDSNQKANARFYYEKYIKDYSAEDPVGADYALYMESRIYFDEGQYKLSYDEEHLGKLKGNVPSSETRYTNDDVNFYYFLAKFKQALSEDSKDTASQQKIDAAITDLTAYYSTGTHKKEIEWQLATYYYSKEDYDKAQTYLNELVNRKTTESLIAKSDLAYIPWAQSRNEKDLSKKISFMGDSIKQFLEYKPLVVEINKNLPPEQQLTWRNTQQDLMDLNICKLYEEMGNNKGGLSGKTPKDSYCSAIDACSKMQTDYPESAFAGDAKSTATKSTEECDAYCDANKGKCSKKCSEGGCP